MTEAERIENDKKYPALVEAMKGEKWLENFEYMPQYAIHQFVPHAVIPRVIQ